MDPQVYHQLSFTKMPRFSCSNSISSYVRGKPCMDSWHHLPRTLQPKPSSEATVISRKAHCGCGPCMWVPIHIASPQCVSRACWDRCSEPHRNYSCHEHQPHLEFGSRFPWQQNEKVIPKPKQPHSDEKWIHLFLTHQKDCQKEQGRWCQVSERTWASGMFTSCC